MKPRVTLCIPTIGRLGFFPQIEEAVTCQTFEDFEVLVLDNASPQAASETFQSWAKRDKRVRVLRLEERVPMFENFARGIAAAEGEYVAFFHDDDVYRPNFLEAAVRMLDAHPTVKYVGPNYDWVDVRGRIVEERRPFAQDCVFSGKQYIHDLLSKGRNDLALPTLVYRSTAFDKSPFDASLNMHFGDFVILMRMAEEGDVAGLATPTVALRRHTEQASQGMPMFEAMLLRDRTLREYLRDLRERRPDWNSTLIDLPTALDRKKLSGLLWAWSQSRSDSDVEGSLRALGALPFGGLLRTALRPMLPAQRVLRKNPTLIQNIARKVANAIGH